jgi:hypothetical protein
MKLNKYCLMELEVAGKGKENSREYTIHLASVQKEGTTKYTESC